MKLLLTITTTKGSNWKEKIREVNDLKIEEVAVFPTVLDKAERKVLYDILANSSIKRVPLVHLRNDMDVKELDLFVQKYDTQIFCTHSEREYPANKEILKYRELICIENTPKAPYNEDEIKKYGGICLDFSHLENDRILNPELYDRQVEILNKFPVKCNHISAIKKEFTFIDGKSRELRYDSHHLNDLAELDYLRNYPLRYFSNFCAIELDNKLSEQMEAMDHINKFMGERDKFINKMLEY